MFGLSEDSVGERPLERVVANLRQKARQPLSMLEGAARQAVTERLAKMLGAGKVVLLEGPAGSGKSAALGIALAHPVLVKKNTIRVARVRGSDYSTPEQAFRTLLTELGGAKGNCDASEWRRFLTLRLAELKQEGIFVVVVVDQCELFAVGKQSLLYVLFDLTQDPDVNMVVVLCSRTQDFVSTLEKRLESRLGTQRLVMPSLSVVEAERVVRFMLTAHDAEDPDAFAEWNARVARMELRLAIESLHRIHCSNVRWFLNFGWTILGLDGDVDGAWAHVMTDVWRARMESLSEVELCVLVVMLRPENMHLSFAAAYEIYSKEMMTHNLRCASKQLFQRAWDNLLDVAPFSAYPAQVLREVVQLDAWSTEFNYWAKGGLEREKR